MYSIKRLLSSSSKALVRPLPNPRSESLPIVADCDVSSCNRGPVVGFTEFS